MEYIAVVVPMPSASVSVTTIEKAGVARIVRSTKRRSFRNSSSVPKLHMARVSSL